MIQRYKERREHFDIDLLKKSIKSLTTISILQEKHYFCVPFKERESD
jgi:hypothetical protein